MSKCLFTGTGKSNGEWSYLGLTLTNLNGKLLSLHHLSFD